MTQELSESLGFSLSKAPDTLGFDLQAGQSWVYPTNYPIREYQFNIVQKALLENTLVSLPTGLGKTFIAAVVMYNFYRWYPTGKVVFMAPTRPLVKQQIDACYDIMAIPKEVTAELTGTKLVNSRADIWKEKRVFFVTPQILQNDLETFKELGPKIKCLVFDEAHRARGNHAYCEVIRRLVMQNRFFRVLALSATPGSTIGDVLEVVQNLLISHLEFRVEESVDVQPYVFKRTLTTVVVPLEEKLQQVRDDYMRILEYYTKTLVKYNVIHGNCGNLTKGKIFMLLKEFQRNKTSSSPNYAEIMKSLNVCVTLYHAYELLIRHGLRGFLSFFNEHIEKPLLRGNTRLIEIIDDVRQYLGPEPNVDLLPDGSYPEVPKNIKFGHPKFYKLREILLAYFKEADASTKVIVFFEYRKSATEAFALLIQERPTLRPRFFLGQGQGVTQREQLNVVRAFREGQCNVLLSTCIGEEGLDVGDVDLIVCFDISNKSPIRMVQRMGRTGRKKEGRITVLVTEGKEQQVLKDCLIHKNNIAFHVLSSREIAKGLKPSSPRLVPLGVAPKCEKVHITVKKAIKKNSTLKDMFRNASSSSSEPVFSPDLELVEIQERIPDAVMLWNKNDPLIAEAVVSGTFSRRIEKQRSLQPIHQVKHSKGTEMLVELLKLSDSKRYNMPTTQIGTLSQLSQNRNLIQSDIRSMFLKPRSDDFATSSSQSQKVSLSQTSSTDENNSVEMKELFSEISSYLSIQNSDYTKKCRHCPESFDCAIYTTHIPSVVVSWMQIDDSVFQNITPKDIKLFSKTLNPTAEDLFDLDFADSKLNSTEQMGHSDVFEGLQITQLEKMAKKMSGNADISLEQLEDAVIEENSYVDVPPGEKSCTYEAPKNLSLLFSRYGNSIIEEDQVLEQVKSKTTVNNEDELNEYEILSFFKLSSLTELFSNSVNLSSSQETVIYSPDIFEATPSPRDKSPAFVRRQSEEEAMTSPVLGKFRRSRRPKNETTTSDNVTPVKREANCRGRPNLQRLRVQNVQNREIMTPSKSSMTTKKMSSTPFVSMTKQDVVKDAFESTELPREELNTHTNGEEDAHLDIDDICDLSDFGLSPVKRKAASPSKLALELMGDQNDDVLSFNLVREVDDFCDLTTFGLPSQKKETDKDVMLLGTPTGKGRDNKLRENSVTVVDITNLGTPSPTKQSDNKMDKTSLMDMTILGTPSKSDYSQITTKSQSQLPITQLLNIINKDDNISGPSSVQSPTGILKDFTSRENIDIRKTHVDPSQKRSRLQLNRSPVSTSTNSDDEFEPSPVFKRPKLTVPRPSNKIDSPGREPQLTRPAKTKPGVSRNPFIEEEAELSEDEDVVVSEDEDYNDGRGYDKSFVADESVQLDTQMHAFYLQSTRSPANRGRYKIPDKPKFHIRNVYSQEVSQDDSYLEDSFVVDGGDEMSQQELSKLEILEQKLEQSRKNKRKAKDEKNNGNPTKRKRIILLSDDSD